MMNLVGCRLFSIYILQSKKSGKFYIGYSCDPWRRIGEHNTDDRTTYTSKYRPWHLIAVFRIGEDEGEAIRLERFLKRQKSHRLMEKFLDPVFQPTGKLAQLVRVPMCGINQRVSGSSPEGGAEKPQRN